ncbi:MAG: ISNCY family transposase [Sedimentisphaerales bacterium]
MNRKEQKRVGILVETEKGVITGIQAAGIMGVSLRHIRRLLAAYRKEGVAALAHGNRGRKPYNAIENRLKQQVVSLASSKYTGFNHQHLTECLAEREDIVISRSSVRNILLGAGIRSPRKRRPPKHRSRRERYPREGMLLQIDGSPHDWLEGRGPQLSLIGAIDDATSSVPCAIFQEQEDSRGYFLMLREIILRQGIPQALYHDHYSVFQVNDDKTSAIEDELTGKKHFTQFGRLLQELGIISIAANSPEAKGRIERLWGTFQDRLVSELRLAGTKTIEEANQVLADFLSRYNQKFAIAAVEQESAYIKPDSSFNPDEYFCFKYSRVAGSDNVVRFGKYRLQILPTEERLSYARCKVTVHEGLDGNLTVYYQGRCLNTRPAPMEPAKIRELVFTATVAPRCYRKPPVDHPWFGKYRQFVDKQG